LNFRGAKEFQTLVAPGRAVVPWKRARYAVLEEKIPLFVHFHLKESASVALIRLKRIYNF
jgi:hypothetical protein